MSLSLAHASKLPIGKILIGSLLASTSKSDIKSNESKMSNRNTEQGFQRSFCCLFLCQLKATLEKNNSCHAHYAKTQVSIKCCSLA